MRQGLEGTRVKTGPSKPGSDKTEDGQRAVEEPNMAKRAVEMQLSKAFVCAKCHNPGGRVERLSMSGTGASRFFDIQPYRYAFVSCTNCGYTEIYNLKVLEGRSDPGMILDIIFSG